MAFGISFGSKKQSGTGTSTIDKTTNLSGTQQNQSTQSGQTNTSTTGTTNTSQNQQGSTLNTQDQTNRGQTTGRQTGTVTSLGQDVQDALSERVSAVLGRGITDSSLDALSAAVGDRVGSFDADSFVSGIVGQARNRGEQTLQEQGSAFGSVAGGTANTNSMVALLAQRGRNDLEANIAGIEAQARAQAEGITNQNLQTAAGVQTGLAGIGEALAGTLKGATSTTDMTSLTDEINQLIGKSGGISNQNTTGTQTQNQNTSTTQFLEELANLITNQTSRETGSEVSTQKGKSGGFGLSLGF